MIKFPALSLAAGTYVSTLILYRKNRKNARGSDQITII